MQARSDLKQLLTRLKLRRLAGEKAFERGAEYFAAGRVVSLTEHAGKLLGTVQGKEEYQVVLSLEGRAIAFDCSCPMGVEGAFCRHCAAVGLAWLGGGIEASSVRKETAPGAAPTFDDVRAWLEAHDKSALLEIILDHAKKDSQWLDRLLARTARGRGRSPRIGAKEE